MLDKLQVSIIASLLLASVVCLILPLLGLLSDRIFSRLFCKRRKITEVISTNQKLIAFSAFLLLSVWLLRFSVGYYHTIRPVKDVAVLSLLEEGINSFLHALMTFSIDDDYPNFIEEGKNMLAAAFGANSFLLPVFGFYTSLLHLLAPIIGGAIIFEILISIFPVLLMYLSVFRFRSEKYYFSELNERSLSLIRSIAEDRDNRKNRGKKPVIIVTGCSSDESQTDTAMIRSASRAGAICVKTDLLHVPQTRFGRKRFILSCTEESRNLQILSLLSKELPEKYWKTTEIYVFSSDDAYAYVERHIRDEIKDKADGSLPVVLNVNGDKNLIKNLLNDLPLFEPITEEYRTSSEENPCDLYLTILGTGKIGMEMLTSAYWCGQILHCRLHITVVSNEPEEAFYKKLAAVNPEIQHTMTPGDDILQIYTRAENAWNEPLTAQPYADLCYRCMDVLSEEFIRSLDDNSGIGKTHYFFTALGTDEDNIRTANRLLERLGNRYAAMHNPQKTVITYAVFDTELCRTLNRKTLYSFSQTGRDIYMKAVGCLDDVYSKENVFMENLKGSAEEIQRQYGISSRTTDNLRSDNRYSTLSELFRDEYSFWSSVTRATHLKYKIFSAKKWRLSVFEAASEEEYAHAAAQSLADYRQLVCSTALSPLLHDLAWLEHRRWNAFMRTQGFRKPKDMQMFLSRFGTHKNLLLKQHLCLVECSRKGILADRADDGTWQNFRLLENNGQNADISDCRPDKLDEVTCSLAKIRSAYDFKEYDYPDRDFIC